MMQPSRYCTIGHVEYEWSYIFYSFWCQVAIFVTLRLLDKANACCHCGSTWLIDYLRGDYDGKTFEDTL